MLNNNTDVTKRYKKNAKYLEYNTNVIPSNPAQEPLSVDLDKLQELNFSITETHTSTLSNVITNALNCIQCNKARIYYFQNHNLPQRVQPATTPNISINYIEMPDYCWFKHSIAHNTSNVFYVIQGEGVTKTEFGNFYWSEGDVVVLPSCKSLITHESLPKKSLSNKATYLLWANDGPLLKYLGAQSTKSLFEPIVYDKLSIMEALKQNQEPKSNENSDDESYQQTPKGNRNGVLLSNQTKIKEKLNTLTPTLWSLYNTIAPKCVQKPHCHNSVALDYCVFAASEKGKDQVYTLMGRELNDDGSIKEPRKMVWKKGSVFITPPGWWHSHINESNSYAYVFPIQDAGLHTYMNTLDIQFVH